MSNNNETLKPGDRVRLTGWQFPSKSKSAQRDFKSFGHKIGCGASVENYFGSLFFIVDSDNANVWDMALFTYEKIQDDGNG